MNKDLLESLVDLSQEATSEDMSGTELLARMDKIITKELQKYDVIYIVDGSWMDQCEWDDFDIEGTFEGEWKSVSVPVDIEDIDKWLTDNNKW